MISCVKAIPAAINSEGLGMKARIALLGIALFYASAASGQLGINCGDHPEILRNKSGIVWFTPEQLEKMAIKRVEPVMPSMLSGFHFNGYVSFRILVDRDGNIGCIWAETGNAVFARAANEALQYWIFKPMRANGRPVEFVGTVKFHVSAN
jgi:hypothetical protein